MTFDTTQAHLEAYATYLLNLLSKKASSGPSRHLQTTFLVVPADHGVWVSSRVSRGRGSIRKRLHKWAKEYFELFRVFWWLTSLGSRFHCFSAEFHRNKASKSVCQMFAESRIYLLQRRTQRILYGESCAHNARRVTWLIRYQVVHDDVPIGSLKKFRNFFFSLVQQKNMEKNFFQKKNFLNQKKISDPYGTP